ncbi:MAG: protein-disulfide reductase DsbD domain-containing protein [Candidatus Acidiferrales bacterium]
MQSYRTPILFALLLLTGIASFDATRGAAKSPQDASALPSPSAVVKPAAYVSLEPVPRGKEFQIAVVVEIARGFHMNSHKPSDQYLIPTTLTAQLPAGIQLHDTIYPDGRLEKFSFSPNKPLEVYTGTVTFRLRVAAGADAALGATTIPITLRYQACNDTTCLQPVKVPVVVKLEVAGSGAKSRALHPEVFSAANSPH